MTGSNRQVRWSFLAVGLASVIAACSGGGSSSTGGGGGGGGGGTSAIPLQIYADYDLRAYVDVQGTYTNVQRERIAAFGGSPKQAGYTWSRTLGAGLPSTITIDPITGVIEGSLPSNFQPGAPGISTGSPGSYYYDLTITVSDGSKSVSSAPGAIRLFVYPCNSLSNGSNAWSCGAGISATPYPYGSPTLSGDMYTAMTPLDVTWDMNVVGIHVNQPFGYTLVFGGGTPPYTFSLASGALPPGLSLDGNAGTILGTPTAAALGNTYDFSVNITDHLGNHDTGYYSAPHRGQAMTTRTR